jgi:hypothetical protein
VYYINQREHAGIEPATSPTQKENHTLRVALKRDLPLDQYSSLARMRNSGIEPESTAWKAAILTIIRITPLSTFYFEVEPNKNGCYRIRTCALDSHCA